ncbi:L,D-transpeptidase family protein [Salinispirillum sp. LH 10-3-1]|uniref:L,D-transpeptidase family protein n=1 Tax=Salinispirillum sp. LH 10-3-1 TaxID=2952525 RepID=A0AB38YI97_9GAMM
MYFANQLYRISLVCGLAFILAACSGRSSTPLDLPTRTQMASTVQEQVELMLSAFSPIAGQALPNENVLAVYEKRNYNPIWIHKKQLSPALWELLTQLDTAHAQGLNPVHYHTAILREYLSIERPTQQQLAELDVIATTALQNYAHDLNVGRYDPRLIDTNWQLDAPSDTWMRIFDLPSAQQMVDYLPNLAPAHNDYQILQRWYVYYRDLHQREPDVRVPGGVLMMQGERGTHVSLLRARLAQTGDLRNGTRSAADDVFDERLKQAVMNFQRRHHLGADGRVGSQTLAALNVPLSQRAEQIRFNLERWRWLPSELEEDRIWVDLTDYQVHIHLDGAHHRMRAVIGSPEHRTAVFRGNMTYFEVNPTWRVPHRIATEVLLPQIQRDPNYLTRNGYQVFQGWTPGAAPIDPATIDWRALDATTMRYRLEQLPDEGNAMGRFKFMFPNRNAIYLHDTPEQRHFSLRRRAYSAGCIRIEDPDLLADLLAGSGRNVRNLAMARNTDDTTVIGLDKPIPVYLVYFTVAPDSNGMPEFRHDVYGRDALMTEAMGRI